MKKLLATASAVVLSLAMVALPAISATADDVEPPDTGTTEPVAPEVTVPEVTEPEVTEPEVTEPEVTEPEVTEPEVTEPEVTEPEVTEPEVTDPEETAPAPLTSDSQTSKVPDDDDEDKCDAAYLKPAALDASSGSYTLMDGSTVIGTLDWGGETADYDLEDGWSVDLCVKSGSKSNPDGSKVTYFTGLTGMGDVSVLQEISHLAYLATYTPPEECPDLNGGGYSVATDDECPEECPVYGARGSSVATGDDECPEECPELNGGGFSVATDDECPPVCPELNGGGYSVATDDECPPVCPPNGTSSITTVPVDEKCDVDVTGEPTDQVCVPSEDGRPGEFVQGSIQLTISDLEGVEKIVYSKDGGAETEVDLAGDLLIDDLAPGKYDFVVTVADGYEEVDDFSVTIKEDNSPDCKKVEICHWTEGGFYVQIDVSVQSIVNPNGHAFHEEDIIPVFEYQDGDEIKEFPGLNTHLDVEGCDGDLPTEGPVTPEVRFTPATCERDGSYTLISPAALEGLPEKTVTWYVNDVETEQGTHSAAVGTSVTVKVVANNPPYVLDLDLLGGFVTEYTYPAYSFTAPTGCGGTTTTTTTTTQLDTLAQTGNDTQPALALTAFLGLLGLALVRAGSRINRNRKEA